MVIHCKVYMYAMESITAIGMQMNNHYFHPNSLDWFMTESYDIYSYAESSNRLYGIAHIKTIVKQYRLTHCRIILVMY